MISSQPQMFDIFGSSPVVVGSGAINDLTALKKREDFDLWDGKEFADHVVQWRCEEFYPWDCPRSSSEDRWAGLEEFKLFLSDNAHKVIVVRASSRYRAYDKLQKFPDLFKQHFGSGIYEVQGTLAICGQVLSNAFSSRHANSQ